MGEGKQSKSIVQKVCSRVFNLFESRSNLESDLSFATLDSMMKKLELHVLMQQKPSFLSNLPGLLHFGNLLME